MDDLRQVADVGVEKRRAAAVDAERIVTEESARAWRQIQAEGYVSRIGGVARRAEQIRLAELERAGLSGLDPKQLRDVDAMTRAMVKKILHPAMVRARALAEAGEHATLDALLAHLGEEGEPR